MGGAKNNRRIVKGLLIMQQNFGVRRFGRVNWLGLANLIRRECQRFMGIWTQTVFAPLVTAGLFLTIFAIAVGPNRAPILGMPYLVFMAPGLLMMTVIQNAFANTSSSILASKVQGNIVDTLMPPLSPLELLIGYICGGIARAILIAGVMLPVMMIVLGTGLSHPLWLLAFVILGGTFMGGLGMLGAIYAQKFDQMAAITNFLITPLAFLSGTFYAISSLPSPLYEITRVNPMYYLIDGARYGVLGVSETAPWVSFCICLAASGLVLVWAFFWLRSGYRLKS